MRHLNEVVLDAPLDERLDAAALVALGDRWLDGLPHRFVRVDDEAGARRLEADLVRDGWQRSRTVLMVRGPGSPPPADARARPITRAEHEALILANFSANDYGVDASPELPRRLVEAELRMLAGTPSLAFGAGDDWGPSVDV